MDRENNKFFARIFCEAYDIPIEHFEEPMFAKIALSLRALYFAVSEALHGGRLDADREIISDVANLSDRAGLAAVLSRLQWYCGAHWNLRKEFGLRISSRRVLAIAAKLDLVMRRGTIRREKNDADPSTDGAILTA